MFFHSPGKKIEPNTHRDRLNVMFLLTSMPIGGAETLLENLIRRLSPRFNPLICCLKEAGELGDKLKSEFCVYSDLIRHKYDLRVIGRLKRLMRENRIDAVVTVGAGDKMFWGRLAAWQAGVPVILSALHSTGWPDGVGRLNRWLTRITDGFIAVAKSHGEFLVDFEKFPAKKVCVIPNGVDVQRFHRLNGDRQRIRNELGITQKAPVCGIIAALRPEKNHLLFLQSAAATLQELPDAKFVIVGDGPERESLESAVNELGIQDSVIFTGSRSDIPQVLSSFDLFSLTSHNEASPVSIMEAMSMELPVVAPDVGSIADTVVHGETGFLYSDGEPEKVSEFWCSLLEDEQLRARFGQAGRGVIESNSSLEVMVRGYENLIERFYSDKTGYQLAPALEDRADQSVDDSSSQSENADRESESFV